MEKSGLPVTLKADPLMKMEMEPKERDTRSQCQSLWTKTILSELSALPLDFFSYIS